MRRGILLFLIVCAAVFLFLVNSVWTLLTLLLASGVDDAIPQAELSDSHSGSFASRPSLIPKIIHQTYKNESIPEAWQASQESCLNLHPDWDYKFWTDVTSEEFIAQQYPWFLGTFKGYKYPIQRADAIRYFLLAHFGGVYIDLDDGCNRPLEPLLSYPAWVRKTTPTGISNDVMGAVPRHPFFVRVTKDLEKYDRQWLLPYITVMASTGPLFLSVVWRHWNAEGLNQGDGAAGGRVRILFANEYMNSPRSFFTHHTGNSWHRYDVDFIFWLLRNWLLVAMSCTIIGLCIIFCAWLAYNRYVLSSPDVPPWKRQLTFRSMLRRCRPRTRGYELVDRHEV